MYQSYSNAAKGLKWVFIGEILALVSIPLSLSLIGSLLSIVGLVLGLAGLYTASLDDENYRPAFYATIASLVISAVSGAVSATSGAGILVTLLNMAGQAVSLFVVYQVCTTTGNLLGGRDATLSQRGPTVVKIYTLCMVVNIACTIISIVPILNVLAALVIIVAGIVLIVGYVLYLTFLYRASRALQ